MPPSEQNFREVLGARIEDERCGPKMLVYFAYALEIFRARRNKGWALSAARLRRANA